MASLHDGPCISTGRSLWRSKDGDKKQGKQTPFYPVQDHFEAEKWNQDKWGIYWTVNEITGERKEENLKRIISWAIDFDLGEKQEQREKIKRFGLIPSLVIESARGYHVYFDALDATKENYNKILTRLCEIFGADQGAKGVNRILRVPFYFHWKDEANPFAVRIEDMNDTQYSEKEMIKFLKSDKENNKPKSNFATQLNKTRYSDFFDKVGKLDCAYALKVLSGSDVVKGERYRFKTQTNGKISVFVNDESSNVWIDTNGRIGSCDKGGPTIYQWLQWFGHSGTEARKYLEEYFPELRGG